MSSILGGGGGSASMPQPPPFHPMDIQGMANAALSKDQSWYQSLQFPVFPGLANVRQSEIEDAYKQLTGPLQPEFQTQFMKNATLGARSSFGGGDPYSAMGMQKDSVSAGAQSAGFAKQALAKQDYDRARMESLINQNPIPQLGLSQNDLLSMNIYNTGAQNQFAMSNYANSIAGANADYASQMAMLNSIGSTIGGVNNIYGATGGFNFGGGGDMTAG